MILGFLLNFLGFCFLILDFSFQQNSSKDQTSSPSTGLEDKMNDVDLSDSPAPRTQTQTSDTEPETPQFSTIPISLIQPAIERSELEEKNLPSSPPASSVPAPAMSSPSHDYSGGPATPILSPSSSQSAPSFQSQPSFDEPPKMTKPTVQESKIQVTLGAAYKKGEGISSFMVYPVTTKTTLPFFRKSSVCVDRRFSDFLGLHDKLQEKHSQMGRIVPPPPSKSMVGTAKAKFAKQEEQPSSDEFLEKRRAALERFLQRNAEHPAIIADPDFRDFLETENELPRSTSTSALSGAGVKRMFSFVSDTVNKMTFKMDETDPVCSKFYFFSSIFWSLSH